jgi:hypothetical protein
VSTLQVGAADFAKRGHHLAVDADRARILRSTLMKPEHEIYANDLATKIATAAESAVVAAAISR